MASTTARTRQAAAARKKAAARPAAPVSDPLADFEPIRIAADDDIEEERVPLFYIGDDEYTIPRDIPRASRCSTCARPASPATNLRRRPC